MLIKALGPYDLKDAIGHGGMGTVFLGIHRETSTKVAIKVLAPAYAADPGFRERFEAEIQSLEKLKHPHIVELFGYGEESGTLYYAMELVEGSNLQKELSDGCRFSWREVIDIAVAICAALKQAHDHGIIHRDIKPANLLISKDNKIKLSDFGIAKLFGNTQITADGGVLGTADYMAPEQAEGIGATARSDLYSVGSVLYSLLAGRPPFQGKSMAEVVHKVRYDDPIPVRHFAPDTPEELERVITKLLSKEPGNRVPTARALSNRLKAIRHALSIHVDNGEGDPGMLDMGADATATAPTRDVAISEEEFADLETVVESTPHPEDVDPASDSPSTHDAPTPATDELPLEARTHYTPVDDEHRRRRLLPDDTPQESTWARIVSIGGIISLLGLLIFVTLKLRQPPTADQLYSRISAMSEEGTDAMTRGEDEVIDFLERFPDDPRINEIVRIRNDIDLERYARQLSTRARNPNRPFAVVEQLVIDAIRKEPLNPMTAKREMEMIISVFETDPDATAVEKKCIRLAKKKLAAINDRLSQNNSTHFDVMQTRLSHAIELAKTDPVQGKKMIRYIVKLFGDKPWAADIITRAEKALDELE